MINFISRDWANQLHWAVTALLLGASISGIEWALPALLGLCAFTTLCHAVKLRNIAAYRIQVRLGFMALTSLALIPELSGILWIPLVGTSAQVLIAYCPMRRILDLMPWNRTVPFSGAYLREVVMRAPGDEGLLSPYLRQARSA